MGIAEAYQINMVALLEQNYLTEDAAIFPGQKLLIVPAGSGTGTESVKTWGRDHPYAHKEPTSTPTLARTPFPTRTVITATPIPEPNPSGQFFINLFNGDTLGIGISLVVVSLLGLALLWFTSSRLK